MTESEAQNFAPCSRKEVECSTGFARDFGIGESLIYTWKRTFREEPQDPFPGKGNLRKDEAYVR